MRPATELVIGTRGSLLALAQTEIARAVLLEAEPSLRVRIQRITTTGDVRADVPLSELGRGIFVSEIERALLERTIDLAVHSAKDLPSTLDSRLRIGAYLPRADARDVLVARGETLATLPPGAKVGTSSPRRMCVVRALRPDLLPVEIRGNVDTRLRKLSEGVVDALLLAGAGLARLGRAAEASEWLDPEIVIPCVGQGAMALEARADDDRVLSLLEQIDHFPTRIAVSAERGFLAELGAGCRAAVGAHARIETDGGLRLQAFIGTSSGKQIRGDRLQNGETPEEVGRSLARELLAAGGREFLQPLDDTLRGKRIAVTRPLDQAANLCALLEAAGARPVCFPTIAIEHLDVTSELRLLGETGATWVAFTSANAVRAVARSGAAPESGLPGHVKLAAVGSETARAVSAFFREPAYVAPHSSAEALADNLPARTSDRVVFFKGDLASETLARRLRGRGIQVTEIVAYRVTPGAGGTLLGDSLRAKELDAVVFTSPSSIKFSGEALELLRLPREQRPLVICLGPTTALAARSLGIAPDNVARLQTAGGVIESLGEAFAARRSPGF